MKIRDGFVSNSSSSSFVCDICGAVESGYDATAEELGFVNLTCGHTICEGELLKISDEDYIQCVRDIIKEKLDEESDDKESYIYKRNLEAYEELSNITDKEDAQDILDNIIYSKYVWKQCPICTNKIILDGNILDFVLKTHDLKKEDIIKTIQEKFENLDQLLEFTERE